MPSAPRIYVVAAGDSLYSIALRFLASGELWPRIADANGLPAPWAIVAGMRLVIPGA
jgi:nucleoid-associated protein YgaU